MEFYRINTDFKNDSELETFLRNFRFKYLFVNGKTSLDKNISEQLILMLYTTTFTLYSYKLFVCSSNGCSFIENFKEVFQSLIFTDDFSFIHESSRCSYTIDNPSMGIFNLLIIAWLSKDFSHSLVSRILLLFIGTAHINPDERLFLRDEIIDLLTLHALSPVFSVENFTELDLPPDFSYIKAFFDFNATFNGNDFNIYQLKLHHHVQIYNLSKQQLFLLTLCTRANGPRSQSLSSLDDRENKSNEENKIKRSKTDKKLLVCRACSMIQENKPYFSFYRDQSDLLAQYSDMDTPDDFVNQAILTRNFHLLKFIIAHLCHMNSLRPEIYISVFKAMVAEKSDVLKLLIQTGLFNPQVLSYLKTLYYQEFSIFTLRSLDWIFSSPCCEDDKILFGAFKVLYRIFSCANEKFSVYANFIFYRNRKIFYRIMDSIVNDYIVSRDLSVQLHDLSFLEEAFEPLAVLFHCPVSTFVQNHMFFIFSNIYKNDESSTLLSSNFISAHVHHVIVYEIIAGNYSEQVNDCSVLVTLMLMGKFRILSSFFKPTVAHFIREHLSKIMFFLKRAMVAYVDECSKYLNSTTCVYTVLSFIINSFDPKLRPSILSHLHRSLEFYLYNYNCSCKFLFMKCMNVNQCRLSLFHVAREIGAVKLYECNEMLDESVSSEHLYAKSDKFNLENIFSFMQENKKYKYSEYLLEQVGPLWIETNDVDFEPNEPLGSDESPEMVYRWILNNFLLFMDFESYEVYAYVIQEFSSCSVLGGHSTVDESEENVFLRQFKQTKYQIDETKFLTSPGLGKVSAALCGLYTKFFRRLKQFDKRYEFLRTLSLLNNTKLTEHALATIFRLLLSRDEVMQFDIRKYICDALLNFVKETDDDREALAFALSVNSLTHTTIVPPRSLLELAIKADDAHSMVYALESLCEEQEMLYETPDAYELVHLLEYAYYRLDDYTRVKVIGNDKFDTYTLYFRYLIERNKELSEICLEHIKRNSTNKGMLYEIFRRFPGAARRRVSTQSNRLNRMIDLVWASDDIERTLQIVDERWKLSKNRDSLISEEFEILYKERFSKSNNREKALVNENAYKKKVTLNYLSILKSRREISEYNRLVLQMILKNENYVLYDYALTKKEEMNNEESLMVLNKIISLKDNNQNNIQEKISEEMYYSSLVLRAEILKNREIYKETINRLISYTSENDAQHTLQTQHFSQTKSSSFIYKCLQRLYFHSALLFEESSLFENSLTFYFKSFSFNYQAIPRFFHIVNSCKTLKIKFLNQTVNAIIKDGYLAILKPYFSQLISMRENPHIRKILTAILVAFPHMYWQATMAPEIYPDDIHLDQKVLRMSIEAAIAHFEEIARATETTLSIRTHFGGLLALVKKERLVLPAMETVWIEDVLDEVVVFSSIQKPKKVSFRGSDGAVYAYIFKANDDLRRDARFMDLCVLLNRIFSDCAEDRMYIRCYDIFPFSATFGILRFVPNLISLKQVFCQGYSQQTFNDIVRKYYRRRKIPSKDFPSLIATYPPIFHAYLIKTYRDGRSFYSAFTRFTYTYTVMAAVGWFMGLGDRHSENILFDSTSGDTVHVDLNMIFGSGKLLSVPETTSFRLTHNIVNGFGFGGMAVFSSVLKRILSIFAAHRSTIIVNLKSFVNDPIVISKGSRTSAAIMDNLVQKLDSLSSDHKIDEIVDSLITENTSYDNLSSMYIGWTSFI